jgi:hypothetical protein
VDSNKQASLLREVAGLVHEYRAGQVPEPTDKHVGAWLDQFEKLGFGADTQETILLDLSSQFYHYHATRAETEDWIVQILDGLESHNPGGIPKTFLIANETRGQRHWGTKARSIAHSGFTARFCTDKTQATAFLLIDDATFTGKSACSQLKSLREHQFIPAGAQLHVSVFARHTREPDSSKPANRTYSVSAQLDHFARDGVETWTGTTFQFDNRRWRRDRYHCYWPCLLGEDELLGLYVHETLGARSPNIPLFRPPSAAGDGFAFESESTRPITEWAFLIAGLRMIHRTRHWDASTGIRPMGWDTLPSLGFGAVFSTYLNVPNTAPLVLWADYRVGIRYFRERRNGASRSRLRDPANPRAGASPRAR